jgi:hypothetical protein
MFAIQGAYNLTAAIEVVLQKNYREVIDVDTSSAAECVK